MTGPEFQQSPLVTYALAGLKNCWMPERSKYSFRYRFEDQRNESFPELDTFYTLNVLLGLSKLPSRKNLTIDLPETFACCCNDLMNSRSRKYAYGMALWAATQLKLTPPPKVFDIVERIVGGPAPLSAQDIGMLASGSIAMAVAEGGRWRTTADLLIDRIRLQYFHDTTRLFYNYASYGFGVELRRGFSSFASQVYPILALYQYGEAFECGWAIRLANSAAERLIALQGPRGEWPWFYYVPGGQIVDFYDVYSVHQHGMAPAFLHHAVAHGVKNARKALIKGFLWLFGENELGTSMLRPAEHLFYRSQLRQGELRTAWPRVARSMFNGLSGQSDTIGNYKRLVLRKECRSYELAWILWSFGGRTDYPELTDREEFQVERLPSSMPVSQV